MDMMDVTEYEFGTTYFQSYQHWLDISSSTWFLPYLNRWRYELELKLKVRAFKEILHEANSGGKNAFAANKWLVDRGWIPQESRGRGRPSKAEINQAAIAAVESKDIIDRHFEQFVN